MDRQSKLKVLEKIAATLNERHITWALGGSLMLYFKGLSDDFHDIDLMIAEPDAPTAKDTLCRLGQLLPQTQNTQYQTRYFLEFVVDGVDVDMLSGFVIVQDGQPHECPLLPQDIEYTTLGSQRIALHSLERWEQYYQLMGRDEKAARIRAKLDNKKTDSL